MAWGMSWQGRHIRAALPDLDHTPKTKKSPRARFAWNGPPHPTADRGDSSFPTSVQPKEINPETATPGIFGQDVPPAPRTETIQEIAQEIREALGHKTSRYSEDFERKCRSESFRTQPATQFELDYRHSFWQSDRDKIKVAFMELMVTRSRQERFAECGSAARVLVSEDGQEAKVVCNKCHDRFCKACGHERQRIITQNMLAFCHGKTLRFVTLTLRHNQEQLERQVTRLYSAFNRLRERTSWKSRVKGGACFFEFKPAKDKDEWHPHLHIVLESDYFPQNLLSSEWLACTGDSNIVDIRFVRDAQATLSYVAKYASKPIDLALYNRPNMLKEAIKALEGRRACMVFGTWRCSKKNPDGLKLHELPEDNGTWIDFGSVQDVIDKALAGDAQARALCIKLNLNGDYTRPEHHPPPEQNPREIPF